ncbi:membrane fusion protein (multidrug efflux system) [Dysgonomonadaceae bacterium PH5-43]|nr:membrane fusion protein (multidrug efflux system) [Dysgonomonadaceae bacterium PH5-43]
MKTKISLKGLSFLLGMALLVSCGEKEQEATVEESSIAKVNTAVAALQTVEETVTYTANVQADVVNQITPTMLGRIEKIYVEIGDKVSKGQLLAQMESSNLTQQITQLESLQKDYDRYMELLKVGGIAQQQVDQVKTQLDVLKTAIANLEENTKLRSPINGVITARNYDNGDVYSQKSILTVEQLNSLKAIIYVSETHFTKVNIGMPVSVKLDVYGDEVFSGKVSLIYPVIDATTHTFGVEIAIDNKNLRVRPGMYSRVTLNLGEKQSIVLQDVAVQKQAGSNDRFVYVIENNVAKYRLVTLGQRLDDKYEVLSGVNPGDKVVVAGQSRLKEGTEVEVINN